MMLYLFPVLTLVAGHSPQFEEFSSLSFQVDVHVTDVSAVH